MAAYVLEKGRPASADGRTDKEIRVYDFLDAHGIEYYRADQPDAHADTMEACREIDEVLQATVVKNLFLTNRQHTCFYLLMMPGEKQFKTKELSGQLGISRLSFAAPEEMEKYLDCTPGSSSVMGLMNDRDGRVQLLVDRDVLDGEYIGCHPCINTSSLKIRTRDIFEVFLSAVGHRMQIVRLNGDTENVSPES